MLKSRQSVDIAAEKTLEFSRLNTDAILPDSAYLDTIPIQLNSDREVWHAFLSSHSELTNWTSKVSGRTVVIDLDETLLINSQICPELWQVGRGYQDWTIYSAYKYAFMGKTWQGHLRKALGKPHYDTADVQKYPFLKNPRHIVMFRPGMLSGLDWLKTQGVQLILVTASAQQRVDYLLKRFPLMAEVFDGHIITANDMASYYLTTAQQYQVRKDQASSQIHRQRPSSLAAKTPALVSSILDIGDYDLIVDDSTMTAELFSMTELRHRLLWVRSDLPVGGYGLQIIAEIVARLTQRLYSQPLKDHQILQLQPDLRYDQFTKARHPPVRLEDPYYWPLCHFSDQLSI